jgi:hypothetical protein
MAEEPTETGDRVNGGGRHAEARNDRPGQLGLVVWVVSSISLTTQRVLRF